ncbi:MAG: helix-turn-helix transcriptional regulator [Firmicutes bacterium]|nr:helix-turn-helix transcriptional regulator [Bacillota bacterium]
MNEHIGIIIANGRKSKGMTQAQFAEVFHVTAQAVGKWERGQSLPDVFTLAKIGELIGHKTDCFVNGKEDGKQKCSSKCSCVDCQCCSSCS